MLNFLISQTSASHWLTTLQIFFTNTFAPTGFRWSSLLRSIPLVMFVLSINRMPDTINVVVWVLNALYSTILSFALFINPFNTWDCYIESNLSCLWKNNVILFYNLRNLKKQLFLMRLFVCLPSILLGPCCQKKLCQRLGVQKKYVEGGHIGSIIVFWRGADLLHTMVLFLFTVNRRMERIMKKRLSPIT